MQLETITLWNVWLPQELWLEHETDNTRVLLDKQFIPVRIGNATARQREVLSAKRFYTGRFCIPVRVSG
jgi:hypothetical protein